MKILLTLAILVLATAASISELSLVASSISETDGVLKCISDRDLKMTINSVSDFCGK